MCHYRLPVKCVFSFACLSHVSIIHDAWDIIIQGQGPPPPPVPALAPPKHGVSLYRVPQPHPPKICSNLFTVKYVRLASGQLASFLVV